MTKYSIGIDVSKNDFHAALSTIDAQQRVKVMRSGSFKNTKEGFLLFEKWIEASCKEKTLPLPLTLEATGIYYEQLAYFLFQQDYHLSVVLPNKAKKYAAALGIKTKNDKVDAKALSRMGAEQALERWQPMGTYFYELRTLTRHHEQMTEMRTQLLNQLEAAQQAMHPSKEVLESLHKMVDIVEEEIQKNTRAISLHLQSDETVAGKVKHLTAIKGVGERSVAVVLAETNGFALFESMAQVVSYAGYDVVEDQSGKRVGKTKISKKGNGHIRRALHMPALSVVRWKVAPFVALYERTLARHGIKMKSYAAVQKKLLALMYTLWKKNEKFKENYPSRHTTGDAEAVHSSRHSLAEAE